METPNNPTKEQGFWDWFLQNEGLLLPYKHTDENGEQVLDDVHKALLQVDENLAPEFGPPAAQRHFIISAGGIKESFPAVLRLQQAQPKLDRWNVTYFRPRGELGGTINLDGLSICSRELEYSILSRNTDIGIEIFIPGYDESDKRYKQIGYLFLDQALGEFDVETKIVYLKFFSSNELVKYDRMPFDELPEHFDELYNRLNGLSGKPS